MKITKDKALSIMESLFFISSEPLPLSAFERVFEKELSTEEIKTLLDTLKSSCKKTNRGICLEEISGGWQIRTKPENKHYLLKIKPQPVFRLSRPSMETLSIIAYEQPCTKGDIDTIRGVESGHLLRTLMEKELIALSGKSDLPGKPSLYKTTNRFLEIFGLASLKNLPSEKEIEEIMPMKKETQSLKSVSDFFHTENINTPYEQDEKENLTIQNTLKSLPTAVDFLENQQNKNTDKK